MTILEAIQNIDANKPNSYTQTQKVKWLSTVDGIVFRDIISQYYPCITEGGMQIPAFEGYTDDTDLSTELLVKEPYDEDLYFTWLESQIDYRNGDYAKYNNATLRFNDMLNSFRNDYNRHHVHKQTRNTYY